jgi:hypothetical protein
MEIMLLIDTSADYNIAANNKIGYIQHYLSHDHINIEYIVYIYGFVDALTEYRERFGYRDIDPKVLMLDLATLVIDNIISIYEIYHTTDVADAVAVVADEHEYTSDIEEQHFECDVSSIYCENPTEASLHYEDDSEADADAEAGSDLNTRISSPSFSAYDINDTIDTADTEVHREYAGESDDYTDDYEDY